MSIDLKLNRFMFVIVFEFVFVFIFINAFYKESMAEQLVE